MRAFDENHINNKVKLSLGVPGFHEPNAILRSVRSLGTLFLLDITSNFVLLLASEKDYRGSMNHLCSHNNLLSI